jgi:Uma2 family endonuclease
MASNLAYAASTQSDAFGDGGTLYEVVNGERREVPRMGVLAGLIATILSSYLTVFARQHRRGMVFGEVLFNLGAGRSQRRPDIAFVSRERIPQDFNLAEDPPVLNIVPNLAIEVISPSNTAEEVFAKIREYFEAGVELVWVIYPRQRSLCVHKSQEVSRTLSATDELDGGTVLPGFRLPLLELFQIPQTAQE